MKIDNAVKIGHLKFKKRKDKYEVEFLEKIRGGKRVVRSFNAINLNLAYLKLVEFFKYGFRL